MMVTLRGWERSAQTGFLGLARPPTHRGLKGRVGEITLQHGHRGVRLLRVNRTSAPPRLSRPRKISI